MPSVNMLSVAFIYRYVVMLNVILLTVVAALIYLSKLINLCFNTDKPSSVMLPNDIYPLPLLMTVK
jgi:hypothetical protein